MTNYFNVIESDFNNLFNIATTENGDSYLFNGNVWTRITNREVFFNKAIHQMRERYIEQNNEHLANELLKGTRNVLKEQVLVKNIVSSKKFDAVEGIISVRNGYLNLKTGELTDPNPGLFITRHIDVEYMPETKNNYRLNKIIGQLEDEDVEVLKYALASSLSSASSPYIFMFYGSGGTGKSTLSALVKSVNPYADSLNSQILAGGDSRFSTSAFEYARALFVEELPKGRLDDNMLKLFVDTPYVRVERKYAMERFVENRSTIFLTLNHLPILDKKVGREIERRVVILPFRELSEEEKDESLRNPQFQEDLKKAMLAYMAEAYRSNNGSLPKSSERAEKIRRDWIYRDAKNVREFFAERGIVGGGDKQVTVNQLFNLFKSNSDTRLTKTEFVNLFTAQVGGEKLPKASSPFDLSAIYPELEPATRSQCISGLSINGSADIIDKTFNKGDFLQMVKSAKMAGIEKSLLCEILDEAFAK